MVNKKSVSRLVLILCMIYNLTACTKDDNSDKEVVSESNTSASVTTFEETSAVSDLVQSQVKVTEDISALVQSYVSANNLTVLATDFNDYDLDSYLDALVLTTDQSEDGVTPYYFSAKSANPEKSDVIKVTNNTITDNSLYTIMLYDGQHIMSICTSQSEGLGDETTTLTVIQDKIVRLDLMSGLAGELVVENQQLWCKVQSSVPEISQLIPVQWKSESTGFDVLKAKEITFDNMRDLDANSVITIPQDKIKNVMKRGGLVHVNYYTDQSTINSQTFIMKDGIVNSELKTDSSAPIPWYGYYPKEMEVIY